MNQNIQDDSLDNLLNQWADERSADASQLDNLQQRISLSIRNDNVRPINSPPVASPQGVNEATVLPTEQQPTFRPQYTWLLRAKLVNRLVGATLVAAVAFVGATHFLDGSWRRLEVTEVTQSSIPDYAQLTDEQISQRKVVLSELKELFGDQLNWLAETESDLEVGLSEKAVTNNTPATQNGPLEIAVRVVVEERSSSDHSWQRAWTADVISQNEEVVELAEKDDGRTTMRMWAYVLPDGMVAIDSELSLPGSDAATATSQNGNLRAAFSNVQKDRQPTEELLTGSDGVEYRVFQTVAVLNKKVG